MSKETITRCDKCLKEVSWLSGVHVSLSERHTAGSPQRAFQYHDSPNFDLCDECFLPMKKAFADIREAQEARIPRVDSHASNYQVYNR